MARSVADISLAMQILLAGGQEPFDPTVPSVPLGAAAAISVKGLRIAFYTDNGCLRPAPALRRAVQEAAAALLARGAVVEEWTPPDQSEAWRIYLGLLFADGMAWARRALGRSRRDWRVNRVVQGAALSPGTLSVIAWLMERAGQRRAAWGARHMGRRSADAYWQLVNQRARYRTRFLASLGTGRFDAVLAPPDAVPAIPHGASYWLGDALSYPTLYNLLGLLAGVVAATRVGAGEESDRPRSRDLIERTARNAELSSMGLPIGVQVAARHWREDVVLAVMAALEEHFSGPTGLSGSASHQRQPA